MFSISKAKERVEQEDKGVTIPFRDIDGTVVEGTSVTVVGSHSTLYNKNLKTIRAQNIEAKKEPSEDEAVAYLAASAIKSWEGFEDDEGKPFPHSLENAVALMTAAPWFSSEVRVKTHDHSAFFTKPSGDSSKP